MYRKLPARHQKAIRHLRYPTIYPASTTAAAPAFALSHARRLMIDSGIMLSPGFLQVGVRRSRPGSKDGVIVWTDDPQALGKEWTEAAKKARDERGGHKLFMHPP